MGLAASRHASVSTVPPATPSAAGASALPASTASSASGVSVRAPTHSHLAPLPWAQDRGCSAQCPLQGVSRARSERAAASSVTASLGCPVTPSPASACVPRGARGPPVTWVSQVYRSVGAGVWVSVGGVDCVSGAHLCHVLAWAPRPPAWSLCWHSGSQGPSTRVPARGCRGLSCLTAST